MKYINYLNNIENPLPLFQFLDDPKAEDLKINELDLYNLGNDPFPHYELVEISEVVERHFIMERCFTS